MLKSQDIVIILKLCIQKDSNWTILQMAKDICLSASEVHASLTRISKSKLYIKPRKQIQRSNVVELLLHGVKYVFPGEIGTTQRGILTAHSAPPLNDKIISDIKYVWPYDQGNVKGISIKPLYPTVPEAALKDNELYELLSLVDVLRIGKTRERHLAEEEILKRIKND